MDLDDDDEGPDAASPTAPLPMATYLVATMIALAAAYLSYRAQDGAGLPWV
jgi:hypothetical protein